MRSGCLAELGNQLAFQSAANEVKRRSFGKFCGFWNALRASRAYSFTYYFGWAVFLIKIQPCALREQPPREPEPV